MVSNTVVWSLLYVFIYLGWGGVITDPTHVNMLMLMLHFWE